MYNYLKNILQNLDLRLSQNVHLPNTSSFIYLLKSLRPTEKDYIATYVTRKEWNLGSPIVLHILQQAGLLTMTEYMLQRIECDDPAEVQLILNDLLEAHFSLLANLVENFERTDSRAHLVTHCLEEGFRKLIEDVVVRGDCVKRNYLREIKVFLTDEQLSRLRMLRMLNLKFLLEMEECSLVEGIGRLSGWMNENNENSALNEVINEILVDKEKVSEFLMKKVVSDKFNGWKWYSNILRKLCPVLSDHSLKAVKSFLKELFTLFLSQKNRNYFFIMMLTARIVCCGNPENFGDYPQWYKRQFSEMRYKISKADFISTMEVLKSLVSLENDVDVLQVYVRTAISPPTLCNDLVLCFKQMCRTKIERLNLDLSGDLRTFDHVVLLDNDSDDMEF